ncbi:hypothetical protein LSG25_11325 [Paralcaligenes sp. KSB-10]|uniref:hypothetical protein n=1 Tax=Paralcaligenes sp. KSB-10 TaxID=2901142 RepID=UPI001E39DDEE|nr:hypothetical protein [Paralcaligenes sp. KSB-10]UHL62675.1 hypothetical protein LSG25_11325 [Paralcaligenes sp. KSB-10]
MVTIKLQQKAAAASKRRKLPAGSGSAAPGSKEIPIEKTRIPLPSILPDPNENFFKRNRPGQAVVRPADLLALRFELHNLAVVPGTPPRLKKDKPGPATLVVHFPPQSITEQTFYETKPGDAGTEVPTGPPVRSRISGESRLAFTVPDDFNVPYTLEGLLTAIQPLTPAVPANALPPAQSQQPLHFSDLFARNIGDLKATQRAALASFAIRSLQIATLQGDTTTLLLRHATGGPGLSPLRKNMAAPLASGVHAGSPAANAKQRRPRLSPRPSAPGPQQTAIELPWRLILSPHAGERWHHASTPVTSQATRRTELWHSRLVAPAADGSLIEPPTPDPQRTVRAVWALTGEGSSKSMQSGFPIAADLPLSDTSPFRMPLNDFDRFQITHLSSNFSVSNYTPLPIDARLLMLSSLGAWLDSRGSWDPPGLSLEEWVHRGTMGRDHYVRVVYKGLLFPFGHRVALVKVSERKFHNGARDGQGNLVVEQVPGNTAYMRHRHFLIVREHERRYADPSLTTQDGSIFLYRQMPFTSVRILTEVTPNLDDPASTGSAIFGGQLLFWPYVNGAPFRFKCTATDLDGRIVQFDLPMIFMDNALANPQKKVGSKLSPDYDAAEANALKAADAWRAPAAQARRTAQFRQQRVSLAQSLKAGDTTLQADEISFDAVVEKNNAKLRAYSNGLSQAIFYPCITQGKVRIPALAQLTGSAKANTIQWNAYYLKNGFSNGNQGQVYADVLSESGMAMLDFSTQGDRSGGFVQPNLKPSAVSRLVGPVSGNVSNFIAGKMTGADAFPKSLSDLPLPLLFGCIPLGDVIQTISNLADKPEQVPRFASNASSQAESFINGLVQLFDLVSKLSDQPGNLAKGAIDAVKHTLLDLLDQAQSYAASLVADAKTQLTHLMSALDDVATQVQKLIGTSIDTAPALPELPGAIATAKAATAGLRTAAHASVGGVSLPAGFRQGLLQIASVIDALLDDVGTILVLIAQGKTLFAALDAIVGHPEQIGELLSKPTELKTLLQDVQAAITPIRNTLTTSRLLDGAPKKIALAAIDTVLQVLEGATELLDLLKMLAGDELTIRFDWNPPINSWAFKAGDPPLFRANDTHGFLVAVEAKVKKNGQSAPKISVVCSLKSFDLVLIAPASFIELNFEKIEFRVDSAAKMDVDVRLTDIKFVGPLSFVETLRDLIPLDGFSDPPHLDITTQGIDAGFDVALPSVAIGVFNLSNLSLGAGFTVPFIGQPLSVRFNFCSREQPFNLSVCMFGGGGFFGITLDPSGIQILEAAFEFGASISIDLGVASGGVHVMAGVYFRMEKTDCSLTGYFRLGGSVSVLGLITASIELYLDLHYEFESGKCVGKAELTIEVEVFLFSASVTVSCERKFAGSNGDPSFRDLMGVKPELALADELALIDDTTEYAWREYAEAFA